MYALGIDLGTTFTAAAVWRDGRAEISPLGSRSAAIPSIVVLREDQTIITGEAAERRASMLPQRVAREFKRRLGDTTPILLGGAPYSAESLMAKLLRAVLDEVSAREGGPPAAVCVSHPANWGPYKTDLLQQAVRGADLDNATFSTEPVAAAVAYAHQQRLPDGAIVAVYDLGGGTFDAAVLRKNDAGFEILGRPEGIERLGGIDFDAAVFAHVARVLDGALQNLDDEDPATVTAVARLKEECVRAKEALSADTETTIPVLLPNLVTEVRLTRGEFETMIRPALQDSIDALRRALRSADIAADQLHSVLLVGGSSRIPIVAQLVGAELARPVAVDIHPKHAVALGAAWLASGLAGQLGSGQPGAQPLARPSPEPSTPPAVQQPAGQPPSTQPTILLPAVSPLPDPDVAADALPFASTAATPSAAPDLFRQPAPGRAPAPTGPDGRPRRGLSRGKALIAATLAMAAVIAIGAGAVLGLKNRHTSSAATSKPSATSSSAAAIGESAGAPGPLVVVAHRGGFDTFPSDTLPALVSAAKSGAVAQADVQWTSDNVAIMIHEASTVSPSKASQATPMVCTGGPYPIAKTTWAVLRSHCSSLASTSADGKRYPIATFDQAVQALAAIPGAQLFPEVTAEDATETQTAGMLATIVKYGMVRRTVVGSFSSNAVDQVRKQAAADRITLRLMQYLRPDNKGGITTAKHLGTDHLYAVTIRSDAATPTYVAALRAQGLIVMSFVVNDKPGWTAAQKAGVEAVFTDTPAAYLSAPS